MIRIEKPAVATSIQDQGRFGHRIEGHSRSGAMDPLSLRLTNRGAGADEAAAGVEFGPGPSILIATSRATIAFGGARRDGAPWWQPIETAPGDRFELSPAREGVWSYLAVEGGVDAPVVLDSRATQVREGIGRWLDAGDEVLSAGEIVETRSVDPPSMSGPIRIFGRLPGSWLVSSRIDRMGYQLEGSMLRPGKAQEWSEPLLPGCVQVLPSGLPIVLMAEDPVVGGYRITAIVHSTDLRLMAQAPPGTRLEFISAEGAR